MSDRSRWRAAGAATVELEGNGRSVSVGE